MLSWQTSKHEGDDDDELVEALQKNVLEHDVGDERMVSTEGFPAQEVFCWRLWWL